MTNSTQEFFRDNPWELIDQPCYPEGRRLYLHDERFWVSLDEDRQILFFVQDRGAQNIKPLENLACLNVTIEAYQNSDYRLVCRLTTKDPELVEKFATVAKDIAFHCSVYHGSQLFLKTQDRIKSWANFLKPSHAGLTHAEFAGFFGELYVLAEHLMKVLSPVDSIRAWIGPDGKKQDFTFGNSAIEVKTTFSGNKQTVSVSSLDQLDRVTDKLYLLRLVVAPSSDAVGLTLGGLYQNCLQYIAHNVVAEGLFLQKASALYGRASEGQIKDYFLIAGESIFDVDADFPKLTRREVNPAIQEVKYDISMGSIGKFKDSISVEEIIKNG